jgi:hypothetical protein
MSTPTSYLTPGSTTLRGYDGLYTVNVEIEGILVTRLDTSHSHITFSSEVRKKYITSIRSATWNDKTIKMDSEKSNLYKLYKVVPVDTLLYRTEN